VPEADFELIRRAWDASSRLDVEGFLECIDPDIELVPFGAAMEGKVYRGHAGWREWYEQELLANWEAFETRPEEFHEVDGRIIVFGRWVARARKSGVQLDVPATWIVDVRNGVIVRWETYTDRAEALRDAGVSEQDLGS
jgi:ketosteroid isomerase-like protein